MGAALSPRLARICYRLAERSGLDSPGSARGIGDRLSKRVQTLAARRSLPWTKSGTTEECLDFIEAHRLYGRGVGWNDLQLLVAARLSGNAFWSLDTRLTAAAVGLALAAS